MIYHITTPEAWKQAQVEGIYTAASLENEGFIHCSTAEQVTPVANAFYADVKQLLLLCVEENKLQAAVKWEAPVHIDDDNPPENSQTQVFPHIYGKINLDAVHKVISMKKRDGEIPYHSEDLQSQLNNTL